MSTQYLVALESLSENQREIAELIGLENYVKLVRRYGGDDIYIQKYTEMLKPSRDREILAKFNGYNYAELAAEYDLSVRSIYKIVSHVIQSKKHAPLDDQLAFSLP